MIGDETGRLSDRIRIGTGPLHEHGAKEVLERLGFRAPRRIVCNSAAEAEAALRALGPPVVVKVLDGRIKHKAKLGGVHLGVTTPTDLTRALTRINAMGGAAGPRRYLVEETVAPGRDLLVVVRNGTDGPGLQLRPIAAPVGDSKVAGADSDGIAALVAARPRLAARLDALKQLVRENPIVRELTLSPLRLDIEGEAADAEPVAVDAWLSAEEPSGEHEGCC